jgi:membrane protease YdiL (CAAX protease family)
MQEIIFRAYVQPWLQNIIVGQTGNQAYAFAWSNLLTNIFFASIHLVRDSWLALYCFFLGLIWGRAYHKFKSLPYVILSHLMIAIWAFFILDIRGVFLMRS